MMSSMHWILFAALGLLLAFSSCEEIGMKTTPWRGRSLLTDFANLFATCPQGPRESVTEETMLNHHDYWENAWGRSDASWPRRGFANCWANRGSECALPDRDHTVCLPGSRRGSTVAKGWAMDPKSQACQPGVHCLYACEPGYYWTTYNQRETSNYDAANAHQKGHCDGTWDYGTSSHGVYCKEDGTLDLPNDKPLCALGETYVYAENRLDTHVFLCQTVFPGHEIFLIPTLVRPGESVMITTQPKHYWHGPTYSSPTHGDFYVSFAGADIMEACTWDEFSPSGASLLPYEIGSGVEDNGAVYSTHYFYQQPNSEVPEQYVGYQLDLECTSSEPGVCGPVFRANNVVKADVLKKPKRQGSTKVKFVFKKPTKQSRFGKMYQEPNRSHLQDPAWITGMMHGGPRPVVSGHYGPQPTHKPPPPPQGFPVAPSHAHGSSSSHGHSAHAAATATSTSSSTVTATATAASGGGSSHGVSGHYPSQNGGGFPVSNFHPDFNPPNGHGHGPAFPAFPPHSNTGRRLKYLTQRSNVYLHNTLDSPISVCSGDVRRSAERASSLGPGEKILLDRETELKISTETQIIGSCGEYSDYHWHVVTGRHSGKSVTYSYVQHNAPPGHLLSLKCVAEADDFCTIEDATSVSIPIAESVTSGSEITFIVKPSTMAHSESSKTTYLWGEGLKSFLKNFYNSHLHLL